MTEEITTYRFVDEQQNQYEINANPNVPALIYNKAAFLLDGDRMSYGERDFGYRFGIDVSYYQEKIDWQKVAADGVELLQALMLEYISLHRQSMRQKQKQKQSM